MREILFRGKRKDNGEWIENICILRFDDDKETVYIADKTIMAAITDTEHGISGIMSAMRGKPIYCAVDIDTIGQYTGLTDKNGNKIFEGDIVKHDNKIYVIKYLEKYARFAPTNSHTVFMVCAFEQLEIIGNIHDNPELLKGE